MLDTDLPAIRGFPEPGNGGLGASMGLAKATHVDAERPAKDLSCDGLVDVSADEQTASVLRAAADRCTADVPGAAPQDIERRVAWWAMAEQHIPRRQVEIVDLGFLPFIGKAEEVRAGTAESDDPKPCQHPLPPVDVAGMGDIPWVVIAGHEEDWRLQGLSDLSHDAADVRPHADEFLGMGTAGPRWIPGDVADQQNAVEGSLFSEPGQGALEAAGVGVHVAEQSEGGHVLYLSPLLQARRLG